MRNWVFVKILTDQPGLWGWGEATLEWHTRSVVGAIDDLANLIVGEDPPRVENLWQMMFRQGPVSTVASLELGFACPSYVICETVTEDVPWRQAVVVGGFEVEREGRIAHPHNRPGLGVEINEGEARKHPFEQEVLQRAFYSDGSVGDW